MERREALRVKEASAQGWDPLSNGELLKRRKTGV